MASKKLNASPVEPTPSTGAAAFDGTPETHEQTADNSSTGAVAFDSSPVTHEIIHPAGPAVVRYPLPDGPIVVQAPWAVTKVVTAQDTNIGRVVEPGDPSPVTPPTGRRAAAAAADA